MAIDIGPGAINRSTYVNPQTTFDKENSANASGTIDTIEIWANTNLVDCDIGIASADGNDLTTRSDEAIGSVTSGSKQTFSSLSMAVETGDYLGAYYSAGRLEMGSSGGVGLWYKGGDNIPCTGVTFSWLANYIISLYGTGTEGVGAQWKQLQYTSEPPTPNAWNQLKHPIVGGWNRIDFEGE